MLLVKFAANHHRVHDRKNFRSLVILFLHGLVVLKQTAHVSWAFRKAGRRAGRVDGVDLAVAKHLRKGLVFGYGLEADFRRQRDGELFGSPRLFFPTAEIGDAGNRYLVIIAQDSPDPHAGGQLILWVPNALSTEVFRLANSTVAIDVDARMAEVARRKNRNSHK